jgi:hypothetical protein
MPKYRIYLRTLCAYEYEIDAANELAAIAEAKELFASQSPAQNLDHQYDFIFADSSADEIKS